MATPEGRRAKSYRLLRSGRIAQPGRLHDAEFARAATAPASPTKPGRSKPPRRPEARTSGGSTCARRSRRSSAQRSARATGTRGSSQRGRRWSCWSGLVGDRQRVCRSDRGSGHLSLAVAETDPARQQAPADHPRRRAGLARPPVRPRQQGADRDLRTITVLRGATVRGLGGERPISVRWLLEEPVPARFHRLFEIDRDAGA